PAHADHSNALSRLLGQCSQLDISRHDRPNGASAHFVVRGSPSAPLGAAGPPTDAIGRRITRFGNHRRSLAIPPQIGLALRKAWRSWSVEGLVERQGFGYALEVDRPMGREVQVM